MGGGDFIMSTTVDNRVVKLVFDNEEFEDTVRDTIDLLKEFEESLDMDDAASGFDALEDAADKLDVSEIGEKANKEATNVEKAASEASGHISKIDGAASKLDFTAIGAGMTAEESKVANSSSTIAGDIDKIDASAGRVSFSPIGAAADSVADRVGNALSGVGGAIDSLGKKISDLNFSGIGKGMEDEADRVTDAASNAADNIDRIDDVVGNLDFTSIGSGVENESSRIADASGEAAGSINRIDDAAADADFSPLGKSAWNATNEINEAASGVSLQPIVDEIQNASGEFDALGAIVGGMLFGLGGEIEKFASSKLKGLKDAIVNPIKEGFGEYETQIGSIQTILANTGRDFDSDTDIDQVNEALKALNTYADDTVYKFTDMTHAIGSFTAAGLDLEEATRAVQGLANMAAFSGAGMTEYHGILPQVAQALTAGTVKLMDWKSFENRSMGGKKVVEFFANVAEHMAGAGLIGGDQEAQDAIMEVARRLQSGELTMRQSLNDDESPYSDWFDSSVLSEALIAYTFDTKDPEERAQMEEHLANLGYAENEMEQVFKLAEMARRSATEVRTLTQLVDTTGEAIGSNWTNIWANFIGDFKQATSTFTFLSQTLSNGVDMILGPLVKLSETFKESGAGKILWGDMLLVENELGEYEKVWNEELHRWERVEGALDHLVEAIGKPLDAIIGGFADAFHVDGEQLGPFLVGVCQSFDQFAQSLIISDDAALGLYEAAKGVGAAIQVVLQIIADVIGVFFKAADAARVFIDPLIDIAAAIGGLVGKLLVAFADEFFEIRNALIDVIQPLFEAGSGIGDLITLFFDWADIPGIIDNVGSYLAALIHVLFEFIDIPGKIHWFADFIGDITGWNAAMEEAAQKTQETGEQVSAFDIWLQNLMKNPVIKFFADLASTIKDKVGGAIESVHKFFANGFFDEDVIDPETGERVATKFGRINDSVKSFADTLNTFKPAVETFFRALGDGILVVVGVVGGFIDGISKMVFGIGELVGKLGEMFLAWEPIQNLTQKINEFKDGAIQWFLDLPNKVGEMSSKLTGHFDGVKNTFGGIFDWFNSTAEYFRTVSGEQFIQDVQNMFGGMVETIKGTFDNLKNLDPQTIVDSITSFLGSIPDKLTASFEDLKMRLDGVQESKLNDLIVKWFKFDPEQVLTLDDSFQLIKQMLNDKLADIMTWWQGIADESNSIPQFIANLFIEIAAVIANKFEEIKNAFLNANPQEIISSILGSIEGAITSASEAIMHGIHVFGGAISPEFETELLSKFMLHVLKPVQDGFGKVKTWLEETAAKSNTIPEFIANVFIGIKDAIVNKFQEIKESLKDFDLATAITSGITNIEGFAKEKFGPFFDTIHGVFQARFPELSNEIDSGMATFGSTIDTKSADIKTKIENNVRAFMDDPFTYMKHKFLDILHEIDVFLYKAVNAIKNFQPGDLFEGIANIADTIKEKLELLFPNLTPMLENTFGSISTFFTNLKENSGTWGELASTVGTALKDGLLGGVDLIFKGFDKLANFLKDQAEKICGKLSELPGPVGEFFGMVGDKIKGTDDIASEGVRSLPGKFDTMFGSVKKPATEAVEHLNKFWDGFKIGNIPEGAFAILENIKTWVGDKLQSVADYIKDIPNKVNGILDEFKKTPEKLKGVIDAVKGILSTETIDWIMNVIKQWIEIKTMMSTNRLIESGSNFLSVLGGSISRISNAMAEYEKSKTFVNMTNGFKQLGAAFLELAGALWIISTIPDPQQCVIIIGEMVLLLEAVEYIPNLLKKIGLEGGGGKALEDMAKALGIFCLDLLGVMYVVEQLTNFDWEKNKLGVEIMGGVFAGLVVAALVLSWFGGDGGKNLEKAAESLAWMAVAASIVAYVVTQCSQEINADGAETVVTVIATIMGAFWLIVNFTNEVDSEETAKAMFKMSEAVAIIAGSLWVLSGIDANALDTAGMAIGLILAEFYAIVTFTTGNDLLKSGEAMFKFSESIAIMAASLYFLADKDWDRIDGAAAGIGGLVAVFGIVTALTEDHDLKKSAEAMDIFSVGVGVMAAALYFLADKDWDRIDGAAAGIGGLVAVFGIVTAFTEGHDLMKSAEAMDIFSVGVGVMAASLYFLAEKDWDKVLPAAGAIDAVIAAFGLVVAFTNGADLIATAGAIDMFAAAVAAIAYSLYELAQVNPESVKAAAGALNDILVPFEVLAGILSLPIISQGAATILPGLAAALAGLGAAAWGIGEGLNAAMDALQKLVIMGPMLLIFVESIAPHVWEFAEAAIGLGALGAALVILGAGLITFGAGATVAGAGLTLITVGLREFLGLLGDLAGAADGMADAGGNIINGIVEGIRNFDIGIIWDAIACFGASIVQGVKDFFGIHSPSELMRDEIGAYIPAGIAEGVTQSGGDAFNGIVTWLTETGWPMLQQAFGDFCTWMVETGWPMMQQAFATFWAWLNEVAIPKVIEWSKIAIEKLGEAFNNFCKWFSETGWPMIKENAGKFWKWLTETGLPKLLELGGKAIEFLVSVVADIGKWVLNDALPMIGKMISNFLEWFGKDGIPMLGKLLTDLLAWLGQVFVDIGKWIVTDGIPAVGKMLGDIAVEIGKWLEGLPGMLVEGIGKIWDGIVDAGKNIVEGIMEGITNFDADAVWKGICEMGNGIVDAAKDFFGINSPSKLMRDTIGQGIPEGIAVGIEKYSGVAETAAENLAEDTADSANKALSVMGSDYEGSLSMSANVTPVMNPDAINKGLFDIQDQLDRMFTGMNYNHTIAQEINLKGLETLRQDINKNFTDLRETMLTGTDAIVRNIMSEGARIDERLIDIEEHHLEGMDVVLDTGELVGALTPQIDQSLGQRQEYTSRGVY